MQRDHNPCVSTCRTWCTCRLWTHAGSILAFSLLFACLKISDAVEPGQYVHHPDAVPDVDDMTLEAVDVAAAHAYGGGDADLESMLHWAISHSDPEVLSKGATDALQQEAIASLKERRARVRELIDVMDQQPTDAALIQEALAILTHPDSTSDHQVKALSALQILVEPIDNANDLKALGGLQPVMVALTSGNDLLQAAAAYVVGTAASNNPKFQEDLIQSHPEVFDKLVQLIGEGGDETVVKGLYATASLVRNVPRMRQAFLAADGLEAVRRVLQPPGSDSPTTVLTSNARAKRKALALLIDLMHLDNTLASHCLNKGLPKTISKLLRYPDADLQEKALDAIKTLMLYSQEAAQAFRDAGTGAIADGLYKELTDHLFSTAGDLDDHYTKYILSLVQEVQRGLKKAPVDRSEL